MFKVWIINGIPGSGKSTTAHALAAHFAQSVHIEGDKLQDFIVSGSALPGEFPPEEETRQIHLNVRNQCLLARSFAEEDFIPVIDYVVVNQERVEEYRRQLSNFQIYLVTLAPKVSVALERDLRRPEKTVAEVWSHLDEIIRTELKDIGMWVNNSALSLDETVDYILRNKEMAKI